MTLDTKCFGGFAIFVVSFRVTGVCIGKMCSELKTTRKIVNERVKGKRRILIAYVRTSEGASGDSVGVRLSLVAMRYIYKYN